MEENLLQYIINGLGKEHQDERAKTQMTLGGFIQRLEKMPPDMKIDGLDVPHSYRGYYSDLAFEKTNKKKTVSKTLEMCRKCLGEKFTGYKGGDFYMTKNTPIWIASWGCCGERIMGIDKKTGEIYFAPEDD